MYESCEVYQNPSMQENYRQLANGQIEPHLENRACRVRAVRGVI
jgi:hypothetical protein